MEFTIVSHLFSVGHYSLSVALSIKYAMPLSKFLDHTICECRNLKICKLLWMVSMLAVFLQCLGAMDETYIRIFAPKYKSVDYWNSKQYP